MKKFITSKKGLVLLATMIAVVASAVGAYAFFTSTGTGTGSATVGTSTAWAVAETAQAGGPLYPNPTIGTGDIQTNTYTVTNPSNGQQSLNSVDIKVALANGGAWSVQPNLAKPPCNASDFSVGGAAVGATHNDASQAGNKASGQVSTSSVTVQMIDNGLNQDNCKGATPPLYYSAS